MNPTDRPQAAFPVPAGTSNSGMSLRDYFAAAALTGLLAAQGAPIPVPEGTAQAAFDLADEMLAARGKPQAPRS